MDFGAALKSTLNLLAEARDCILLALGQKPPKGPDAPPVTDQAIVAQAEIDLGDVYARLLSEGATALKDLQQQGLAGDELADAWAARVNALSDQLIEDAGRASTSEAFNLGRNLEAQAQSPQIGEAIRTEILDKSTCDPCRSLDGKVVEFNSPDYFRYMPPNFCEGREFCRGFYLYRKAA